MDLNQAVNTLIEGVVYAQSKGVYSLMDAKNLATALEVIDAATNAAQEQAPQIESEPNPVAANQPVQPINQHPIPPTNGGFVQS